MAPHRSISILASSLILPSQKPPHPLPSIALSNFDLLLQCFQYNQRILFYDHPSPEFPALVHCLKASLPRVLGCFYPLAGRLALGSDPHGSISLHIVCNDAGVEFIEASTDATLAELLHPHKPPIVYQMAPANGAMNMDGFHLPLLIVQVTQLFGGGIALGLTINHLLADGNSTWHFINSWAELCRGKISLSLMPVYDRSLLEMDTHGTIYHLPPPQRIVQSPELQEIVVHFSSDALSQMKKHVNGTNMNGKSFSTYQALCAHLWKWITATRRSGPNEITRFKAAVDYRRRLVPPLPRAYFGNAVNLFTPKSTVKELEKQDASYGASLLNNAIESCTDETIRSEMKEIHEKGQTYEMSMWGANDISVSSSFRFPVYECDFGWGRPVGVRSGLGNKCDGKITLFSGYEGGGSVDVEIALYADSMQRFAQLVVDYLELPHYQT